MPTEEPKLGILLVGHGTVSEAGTAQFLVLAEQLARQETKAIVEPAFLELRQPDVAAGLQRLAERGAERVVVAPLLLFAAGHAKRDIPEQVRSAAESIGWHRRLIQTEHLGCHPAIVLLSQRRNGEALTGMTPVPADQTALVLVGRGSLDDSATAEVHEFARLRHQPEAAGEVFVGFLAMARPPLGEVLEIAASRGFRRVVVQPHLLFAGELADTIEREVSRMQVAHPDQEWLATPLLADSQDSASGGNQLLLQAMGDRIRAAIRVVASGPDD
jgi:sirohydrochlorin cobaltochelatase